MAPQVSVIVPVYNTEKYVEKCVRSIMGQTFDDIEILCVDDRSPDRSSDIVTSLAREDRRIKLIRHEQNLGLGGARNTAIDLASAPYIAGVDSDDYIDPDMIEALVEGTDRGRFDVVVCGFQRVDPNGQRLSVHMLSTKTLDPIPPTENLFKISNPAFWNKLWRRSLYVDNGIYFPNHVYYQDQATTARIYSKAQNVNFIGGERYKYLVRPESVTSNIGDKHQLDRFRVLDVLKTHFKEMGAYEKHPAHFEGLIDNAFRYHAENTKLNNDIEDPRIRQYLRHLLLLRQAYAEHDDALQALSSTELYEILRAPVSKFNASTRR